jgi:hypothetical protein
MYNNTVIDNLLHEHEAIRAQMKLVKSLVDGWNDNNIKETHEFDSKGSHELNRRKLNLQQAVSYLDEGLRQHHLYEKEILPYLIGNPMMDAILTERETMMKRLEEINYLLLHIPSEGLAAIWGDFHKVVNNFSHWLIDHNMLEDVILNHLKENRPVQVQSPVLANVF